MSIQDSMNQLEKIFQESVHYSGLQSEEKVVIFSYLPVFKLKADHSH